MKLEDGFNKAIWKKKSPYIAMIDTAFPDNKFYYKEQYKVFMCELVREIESKNYDLFGAIFGANLLILTVYLVTLKKDGKSMSKKK